MIGKSISPNHVWKTSTTNTHRGDAGYMLAVVKFAPGIDGIELRHIPVPEPGEGEVILQVIASGICGTDVHIAKDEYAHTTPVVMGHEILGIVSSVGSDEDSFWLGKRVAVETYYSACEKCPLCRSGRRNLCSERKSIGSFCDGGFAEFVRVPTLNLHEISNEVSSFDAVLAEPLACIANCLMNPPRIESGQSVLVTGPGTMGQLAAQVARLAGASVLVSGVKGDKTRLEIASSLGFETVVGQPKKKSFDVVIECSGNEFAAAAAMQAVKRGGNYIQVGIFGHDISVPFDLILLKELTISSGFASTPQSWLQAMELLGSGGLNLKPLVTQTSELQSFTNAFASVMQGSGLKTVLTPGAVKLG